MDLLGHVGLGGGLVDNAINTTGKVPDSDYLDFII
jgi:hypothetical protein